MIRATSTCRQCGAPIAFRELPNGKWQPLDPDTGTIHFATCPRRKRLTIPDDQCHVCGATQTTRRAGTTVHYAGLTCLAWGAFRWLPRPR